jgi:hypothetical protein
MKNDYDDNPLKREKEVIIFPGHTLTLEKYKDHVFTWHVSK